LEHPAGLIDELLRILVLVSSVPIPTATSLILLIFSTCFSCFFFNVFLDAKRKTQQMVSFRKTPAFGSIEAAAQILEEKTFQRPWRGSEGS
jgi:hypothetical protein